VLPDVPAIDKAFDYAVPAGWDPSDVRVGSMVRIRLHGRPVGGWVIEDDVVPAEGLALLELGKVRGWGPPPEVLDLSAWAAWRWAGRRASLLTTASPVWAVRAVPAPAAVGAPGGEKVEPLLDDAFAGGAAVLRWPPGRDPFAVVAYAASRGAALILAPSTHQAAWLAGRLRSTGAPVALLPADWSAARGGGVTVVGTRAAAWAPMPRLDAAVVLDGHDESYQSEQSPTWHARDVVAERARRVGVPLVVTSPCPDLDTLEGRRLVVPPRPVERNGWPRIEVADRRQDDPSSGLYGPRLVALVRDGGRVLCVLNRKGRARLLACNGCNEVARCEQCEAAVEQSRDEPGILACRRCTTRRPEVCAACGAQRLRKLRVGVTRVREELEALAGRSVGEVTADTTDLPPDAVLVGTEALLHRAGRADAVVFLDFDQELLAPRYRATEQALALLARAARLVGGRSGGGRLLVQTRLPDHAVIAAARHGDPGLVAAAERADRQATQFPPFSAIAVVSGAAADALVSQLDGVEVLRAENGDYLVRAPDHATLCDALARTTRPPGRLRVEVDPLRI